MGYGSDRNKIRKEFIAELKKAKSKKDVGDITYQFILKRIGGERKTEKKERDLITKMETELEKAIPKDKIHLLKDYFKYRKQIELANVGDIFIRAVNFMIDYGNIITAILIELDEGYKLEYKKTFDDIDA